MTGEKKASATKYHRRALMIAADRLLSEHGYDGMNMNMLAKEANYSKATVYVYFPSKDEIVGAIALERLELMERELGLVVKNDLDPSEKLGEVGRVIREFAAEDRVYFDFLCERACLLDDESDTGMDIRSAIDRIVDELCAIADKDTLLNKWYAYYGKLKTESLFTR